MNSWLPLDITKPATPALVSGPGARSPAVLEATVGQFDVASAARYQPRDLDGDGHPETFCNVYAADIAEALGDPLPRVRANDLLAWLESADGQASGWTEVTGREAQEHADNGRHALVLWRNVAGPGHVGTLVPSRGQEGIYITAAGGQNFARCTVARSFGGAAPLRYFIHP